MNRAQALTIGILIGFVLLACIGVIIVMRTPLDRLLPPTATPIPPSPTITPSPTFPKFLPTAEQRTPEIIPSPTNTRLPTSTPTAPRPPTATVVFKLPTPKPSATPSPPPTAQPVPSATPTVIPPTAPPRQYSISFEADESTIIKGKCTDLEWRVVGVTSVKLDGRVVSASGFKEVCPRQDTDYELTIQLPDNAQLQTRTVRIIVEEE